MNYQDCDSCGKLVPEGTLNHHEASGKALCGRCHFFHDSQPDPATDLDKAFLAFSALSPQERKEFLGRALDLR